MKSEIRIWLVGLAIAGATWGCATGYSDQSDDEYRDFKPYRKPTPSEYDKKLSESLKGNNSSQQFPAEKGAKDHCQATTAYGTAVIPGVQCQGGSEEGLAH